MSLLCRVVRSRQCKIQIRARPEGASNSTVYSFLTASATARQRVWRSNNSPLRAFTALGPLSLLPHRFTQGAANVNVDTGHKYRCQYRDALYTKPMGHKSVSCLDDSTVSARELPLDSNWSHLQKTRSIDTVVFGREHVVQRQRSLAAFPALLLRCHCCIVLLRLRRGNSSLHLEWYKILRLRLFIAVSAERLGLPMSAAPRTLVTPSSK